MSSHETNNSVNIGKCFTVFYDAGVFKAVSIKKKNNLVPAMPVPPLDAPTTD